MTLANVTSVFTRYFIIGFFLPPFFALLLLWQTLEGRFPPNRLSYGAPADVAILGGVALLLGLLLIAYRQPLRTLLEGYPGRRLARPLQRLFLWFEARQRAEYEAFRREIIDVDAAIASSDAVLAQMQDAPDPTGAVARMRQYIENTRARQLERRSDVARLLDRYFPHDGSIRPTRLGNTVRAWQSHSFSRWGLDSYAVWPRINLLLEQQERDRHDDAETDLAFFINSCLVTATIGATYLADWILYRPWFDLWWVAAVPLTYSFYRSAVGAAARWGDEIRSSVDIHRLELYEKLGVLTPSTARQERLLGEAINDCLLRGTPIAAEWRKLEDSATEKDHASGRRLRTRQVNR